MEVNAQEPTVGFLMTANKKPVSRIKQPSGCLVAGSVPLHGVRIFKFKCFEEIPPASHFPAMGTFPSSGLY